MFTCLRLHAEFSSLLLGRTGNTKCVDESAFHLLCRKGSKSKLEMLCFSFSVNSVQRQYTNRFFKKGSGGFSNLNTYLNFQFCLLQEKQKRCFTSSLFYIYIYIHFLEELHSHIGENMQNRKYSQLQHQKTNIWYMLQLFCPNLLFYFYFCLFFLTFMIFYFHLCR